MKIQIREYALIVLASMILLPFCSGFAAENETPGKISYSRFIENIKIQLPDLKRNKIASEKAKNTLYGAGSSSDINLTGETGYGKTDTLSGSTSTEKRYTSSKLGLTKKITETGTDLGAGVSYNRTEYDIYGSETYHSPSVYVKFSQSLLKNAFGTIDRYAVNNARMQYGIEKLRETESDKTSMNYYKKLYFKWIEYREELELLNNSIETAKKLAQYIKSRTRSGMANNADMYSTEALVLKYRIAYEELKTNLNIVESELEIFFKDIKKTGVIPDRADFNSYYSTSVSAEFIETGFGSTVNAEIYRLTKENLLYTAGVNDNRLLPQLDLVGEYTKKSEGTSFSESAGNMNSSDYYLGFSFSYPLQNTESRSRAEETRISISEINAGYDVSQNAYRKSLGSIINIKNDSIRIINLREKRIEALDKKYGFEYQKYRQSQLDLETLLNTSIEITSEKISLIQLKKQMIENYIDYLDLTSKAGK